MKTACAPPSRPGPIVALVLVLVAAVGACTPLIGAYSPRAYEHATSLKAETLALVERADEPYRDHRQAAERLMIDLQRAYEYVRGVPRNAISARQWRLLVDPEGDLVGRFMRRWRDEETLSPVFIAEFRAILADAFDEIICLEANKREPAGCHREAGPAALQDSD